MDEKKLSITEDIISNKIENNYYACNIHTKECVDYEDFEEIAINIFSTEDDVKAAFKGKKVVNNHLIVHGKMPMKNIREMMKKAS